MARVRQGDQQPAASEPVSIGFVGTHPGLPRLLTGVGPEKVGGAELQLSLLCAELARRGHRVTFGVGGYKGVRDAQTPDGAQVRVLYALGNGQSQARKLIRPVQLLAGLRRMAADTYIVMGAGAQAGIVAGYCRATGRRFILWLASDTDATCHIDGLSRVPPSQRWLAHRGLLWADAIVAQTHAQADAVRRHTGREAVVIPNIWPHEVGVARTPDDTYALWVSNIRPEKRPEMLLDIAESLPDIPFVMVGGPVRGYEQLHDETQARAAGLANVSFLGFVPIDEVGRYFADAALLVNTSAVEGFPNTYLQAWAVGKPVVGSFDPDGIIAEHGLGAHFSDAREATAAIRELWNDNARLLEMGSAAVTYLSVHHSADAVVRRVEEVLTAP